MIRMLVPHSSMSVAVAQRVDGDTLANPGGSAGRVAGGMHHDGMDRMLGIMARKQPARRPCHMPVRPRDAEQLRRQHNVAVATSLALFAADDHAAAVDISPSYSPNQPLAIWLRLHNRYVHTPPSASLTAFETVSARRWRLIRRSSTGALAPSFTSGARSARRSIHGTMQRRGSWRRMPA
jgi:hypothetical protein